MYEKNFENALAVDTRDLVEEARQGRLPTARFRQAEIEQTFEHLRRNRSVLLTGPPGVGKTYVVLGLAQALAARETPGLAELSTTRVMAGTKWLGEWQTKLTAITRSAVQSETILYLKDVWNLPTVGTSSNDPANILDSIRPQLESGELLIIGEASPVVEAAMERVPAFVSLFERVVVEPMTKDDVAALLRERAEAAALPLDEDGQSAVLSLTSRFLPHRPQPGPALNLLDHLANYLLEKERVGERGSLAREGRAFIERVFSIYSGLPLFVVSRSHTRPAREIRSWFQGRIVGQRRAIEAVVEMIALFKAGLQDPGKPLGTFLFVGPTGVGKTELARTLARFLFGSEQRLLRFDMSEFKDYHAFEMLLGNPKEPMHPAKLLDPVRAHPFQVLLFDELEKAHANIWDVFLQLLDDGRLSPAGAGEPVSFRNTIVIATSNVGAQSSERALGFGATAGAEDRAQSVNKALERAFRPEFLNRFQHIVIFDPLTPEQLRSVARVELKRILGREGISERNLVVDVDDKAIDLVISRDVDPRWGARALKRALQRRIVLPLAMTIMERGIQPGTILKVAVRDGRIGVRAIETPQVRARRREQEPIRVPERGRLSRAEITDRVAGLPARIVALEAAADAPALRQRLQALEQQAESPDFWARPREAALVVRDKDQVHQVLDRLDDLRWRAEELAKAAGERSSRDQLERIARQTVRLEEALQQAHRELVVLGHEGSWDALVEVRPAPGGDGRLARDLLLEAYRAWAEHQGMTLRWLREPMSDDESALLAIDGPYAYGLLRREAGLHRVRDGDRRGVAVVTTGPWTDQLERPEFEEHLALKARGQMGGRVRSRLVCSGGLVLQNAGSLGENRDLASELVASWRNAPAPPDVIVRRYDLGQPLLRDALTGLSTGRPDALAPRHLHELLLRRVDAQAPAE